MALDQTAFATGLLGQVNANIAQERKQQNYGAEADYQNFQKAQEEYQKTKNKNAQDANSMDNIAGSLAPDGSPDIAAYSTARWAVENGYSSPEHLPFVQEVYKRTKNDTLANPDKWGIDPDRGTDVVGKTGLEDTNPVNTQHLRMFNRNLSTDDIENVRQHNISSPYSNVPSPVLPDAAVFELNKKTAEAKAAAGVKKDVASSGWVSLDDPSDHAVGQPPAPTSSSPDDKNPLAVPEGDLQPGGKPDGGITLPGPAPDDGQPKPPAPAANQNTHVLPNGDPDPRPLNDGFFGRLKSASPVHAGYIKSVADGKTPWPSTLGRNPDEVENIVAAVNAYDPTASEQRYKAAQDTIDSFTKGNDHKEVDAINTAAVHTGELASLTKALQEGQTNNRLLNKLANDYGVQLGGSNVTTNYNLVAFKVAEEVTKAYQGSNVTEAAIQNTYNSFISSGAPGQLSGGITETAKLLKGKADAKDYEYKTNMGPAYDGRQLYSPDARAFFKTYATDHPAEAINGGGKGQQGSGEPNGQAPQQAPDNMPSVKSPDEAMKLPPGSQFKMPDGRIGTVPGKPSDGKSGQ